MIQKVQNFVSRGLHAWRSGGLKFLSDLAALASGQFAAKAVGFVAFAYLARVLEPTEYGAVEYVVGLSVFFALVVEAGLGPIGVRRTIQTPASLPTLAFQIPLARLVVAVVGVPVMALFATAAMKDQAPAGLIWLFALSLLLAPWRQDWLLQASGRMKAAALSQVLRPIVFGVVVWVFVRGPGGLLVVGWAEVASVTAMTAYVIWIQHTRIAPFRLRGSVQGLGALFKEGWGMGSTNIIWATNQYAPLFLVGAMLGGVQLAWFGAAARIAASLLTFSNLYHFNLYPTLARATSNDPVALGLIMRRSFRVVSWGGVGIALAFTLFADLVTRLAFGPKLAEAAPILQILVWSLPLALCSGHARWGLVAAGAQTSVLWSQVAGLGALLLAAPLLGNLFGVMGYAIAAVISALCVWLTSHIFAVRREVQPPPFNLALRPAALAAAILWAWRVFWPDAPWAASAGLALFAAAAPLLDPRLIPDFILLAGAKRSRPGDRAPTPPA